MLVSLIVELDYMLVNLMFPKLNNSFELVIYLLNVNVYYVEYFLSFDFVIFQQKVVCELLNQLKKD